MEYSSYLKTKSPKTFELKSSWSKLLRLEKDVYKQYRQEIRLNPIRHCSKAKLKNPAEVQQVSLHLSLPPKNPRIQSLPKLPARPLRKSSGFLRHLITVFPNKSFI